MNSKVEVSIDWLTFTVQRENPNEVISEYLGMDPDLFQDPGYGLLGYEKMKCFSDICVCYSGRENEYFHDMGVCVSMSGNGCRSFETMSKLTFPGARDKQGMESIAFPVLFQLLASDPGANVTRLDIACDDRSGILDMDEIISKTTANDINSRMARRQVVFSMNGAKRDGATVYLGAPSSNFRVRIYDKGLEQGISDHWIRVEIVLRSNNSNAFVGEAVNSACIGCLASQVMNDRFSFIERDDCNISRCSVCSWWQEFVDELGAVELVARKVIQHSVEHINNWVSDQVGPSLAIILKTMGWGHLFQLAQDSYSRLSDKQKLLISDYNSSRLAVTAV